MPRTLHPPLAPNMKFAFVSLILAAFSLSVLAAPTAAEVEARTCTCTIEGGELICTGTTCDYTYHRQILAITCLGQRN
ncbi:hypothetical protein FB451DRAFT_1413533 [Mycena latifolia]|nr:hypothetical protein FB451DRAFT_1413533 [Mycena latifolia]